MLKTRQRFLPSPDTLENRLVLNAGGFGQSVNIIPLEGQMAAAFGGALQQVIAAETGAASSSSGTLQSTIAQQLSQLSQNVTQAFSAVPFSSLVSPLLQNEIVGTIPGSLQQMLSVVPNSIGALGSTEQGLFQQLTSEAFQATETNVLGKVMIFVDSSTANVSVSNLPTAVSNLGQVVSQIVQSDIANMVHVLQSEESALTPGGTPASPPLSQDISNTLNALSQQVGSLLGANPVFGSASGLAATIQSQINGTTTLGGGSILQLLQNPTLGIPASISDTGSLGTVEEALSLEKTIDAFLAENLATIDDLTISLLGSIVNQNLQNLGGGGQQGGGNNNGNGRDFDSDGDFDNGQGHHNGRHLGNPGDPDNDWNGNNNQGNGQSYVGVPSGNQNDQGNQQGDNGNGNGHGNGRHGRHGG